MNSRMEMVTSGKEHWSHELFVYVVKVFGAVMYEVTVVT